MNIEYTPVRELRPHPNNARTHSRKQIRQIAKSIEKFGFCNPVLIDNDKQIIAGHGRVEAAKLLGIDAVPRMVKKLRLPKDEQFGDVCCEFAEAPAVGQQPVQQIFPMP